MTLTELSYYSRKMLPFGIILLLILLIFFYMIRLLLLYNNVAQPVVTQINPIFNKIDKPFVKDASASAGLSFFLDTIEGEPVTATPAASVYFIPPVEPALSFRQRIFLMAKAVGIDTETTNYSLANNSQALFDNGKEKLDIDIARFNFTYEYKMENLDPGFFSSGSALPDKNVVQNQAADFLKAMDRYPEELAQGKTNIILLKFDPENSQIQIVEDIGQANMAEVDFFRNNIDGFPIVTPKFSNSQNYVLIAYGPNETTKVIKAKVNFLETAKEQVGIYPIKTGVQAWEDLKSGKGMIVSGTAAADQTTIKKMFLGYLDPGEYQQYLQPVYVFLGDNDFVAYVPGIDESYYSN